MTFLDHVNEKVVRTIFGIYFFSLLLVFKSSY